VSLLPPNATGESRVRCELARQLARGWSVELGREIALTGSASRGVADDLSDIELNFWVDRMRGDDGAADQGSVVRVAP